MMLTERRPFAMRRDDVETNWTDMLAALII